MKIKILAARPAVMEQEHDIFEGEELTTKIARMRETNSPIEATDPMIYTARKDGVLPAYDIRTDKWEIAEKAMSKVVEQKLVKRKEAAEAAKAAETAKATEG